MSNFGLPDAPETVQGEGVTYFDHNATGPLHPAARAAWLEAAERFPGNPSSPHRLGHRAEAVLGAARDRLAGFLGGHPDELVWTSGATESANTVWHHLAATLDPAAEVWVPPIEHPCVLRPAEALFGPRVRHWPVTREGVVDLTWLAEALSRKRPGAIAVMAANHETGVLQPWNEVLALARMHGVPVFVDATQWAGRLAGQGLGEADFVAASAHKFGGPKGVGFLKCPGRGRVMPLLVGGPQESGRRAGTENVPGVLAMLAALEVHEWNLVAGGAEERLAWRTAFEERLVEALPETVIVGAASQRLWNTVAALLPSADARSRWVVKLDKLGFPVSTGSACASGREEPSPGLEAMGYSPAEAGRALRFSAGWETTAADWDALLGGLREVAAGFRVGAE